MKYIEKRIREVNCPNLNGQVLSFRFSSFPPAYRKAFRREASEVPHQVQGSLEVDSRKGEDSVVTSAKLPINLKLYLQVKKAFQGSRIGQGDENQELYI